MASSIKWVFCQRNIDKFSKDAFEAFKSKYPEEKIDVKECAGTDLCSLCLDVPFAIRNGSIVHAKNDRDLYYKLDNGMQFLNGPELYTVEPAPPKEEAPKEKAETKPAAAPKADAAQKAETASQQQEATTATAPKTEEATKAES